jgi:hypothetical protein
MLMCAFPKSRALAPLVIAGALMLACTQPALAETYEYSDHFTTDVAEVDSYSHSPICDEMPEIWIAPFLIYQWEASDRVLAFYGGFDPGLPARLRYRFPLGSVPYVISACDIQFTLTDCAAPFSVDVSSDGVSWSRVHEAALPGIHAVHLDYPDPLDGWLYVCFASEHAALTSFAITMSCTTPVEESTWGALKALYK